MVIEIAVVVAPAVFKVEPAAWVQPPAPVRPAPVPVLANVTVPLLVTVPEVTVNGPVPAPDPNVIFAVEATDIVLEIVTVPVLVTEPVPSITQLAVFKVAPPVPL